MKNRIVFVCVFLLVILAACNSSTDQSSEVDVKSLIHDYSTDQISATSASVDTSQLVVEKDNKEVNYDLPDDEFYVSIAPFINETHPCTFHSLTGCQGELVNTPFEVYIENANGNVLIDESIESFDNGFIDLWLPRDQEFKVIITLDDKQVESTISTFEDDPTCITTMQLI